MKKGLVITFSTIIVLILAAIICLPFAMGFIAQAKYPAILASLSRPGEVQVNLLSYHRGWFQSDAVVEVKIFQPGLLKITNAGNQNLVAFKLAQNIQHGPWILTRSNLSASPILFGLALMQTQMNPALGDVQALSFMHLDGSLTNVLQAKNIHMQDKKNNLQIIANNLNTLFRLSADLKRLVGQIHIQRINVQTLDFVQDVVGLSANYQLHRSSTGTWIGDKKTQVQSISWETPSHKERVALSGLQIVMNSTENNAKLDVALQMQLAKLALDAAEYGPQEISLHLRQIDMPTVAMLEKELTQMSAIGPITGMQLMRYNQLFMQLLSKGMQLEIEKFDITTAWGAASATANVMLQPLTHSAITVPTLLSALNATVHVEFPASVLAQLLQQIHQASVNVFSILAGGSSPALLTPSIGLSPAQQAQQQMTQWIQSKWIIPHGNGFKVDFTFKNGQALLNGIDLTAPAPATITPPASVPPVSAATAPTVIHRS